MDNWSFRRRNFRRRQKKSSNQVSNKSEEIDWGSEFCKISEIYGFAPSHISELSLPQFLTYSRYANKKLLYQPNLENINEYLNILFGGVKNKSLEKRDAFPKIKIPDKTSCKIEQQNKINNLDNIIMARNSLIKKTGRSSFAMQEIFKEINLLSPSDDYRLEG